ncbi:aldo/keto reductase [Falsarthrobacter nasiphocae]
MLGPTGLAASEYALGTMTFGGATDEATAFAMMDRYVEAGGNVIDTADIYNLGASEEIVGRWLAARPDAAPDVVLASKARFGTGERDGVNQRGYGRKFLHDSLEGSLRRLGVDSIDLFQLHAWDPRTPITEALRFLNDAMAAGRIHAYGLSNFTGWQITKTVYEARLHGWAEPVSIQPQYSLLVREIESEILDAADDAGMAVLPWSPLAGGWLSGKYRKDDEPSSDSRFAGRAANLQSSWDERNEDPRTWAVLGELERIASAHGCTVPQAALAWTAAQPGITSVLLGARTMEQLEDNLGAVSVELTADDIDALNQVSKPALTEYPYGAPALEQRSRDI